jgi:hypothetical protein
MLDDKQNLAEKKFKIDRAGFANTAEVQRRVVAPANPH